MCGSYNYGNNCLDQDSNLRPLALLAKTLPLSYRVIHYRDMKFQIFVQNISLALVLFFGPVNPVNYLLKAVFCISVNHDASALEALASVLELLSSKKWQSKVPVKKLVWEKSGHLKVLNGA